MNENDVHSYKSSISSIDQWAAQGLKLAMVLLGKYRHYHMHNIQRRYFNSTAALFFYS
jgi:serine/threonine-protein kinase HipA